MTFDFVSSFNYAVWGLDIGCLKSEAWTFKKPEALDIGHLKFRLDVGGLVVPQVQIFNVYVHVVGP